MAGELRRSGEIHHAVAVVAAAKLAWVFFRRTLDQHALGAADHGLVDRARLTSDQRLQSRQALLFHLLRGVVGKLRRGRARPRAVEEGVGIVEADFGYELHGRFEIALGFAGETDDEVR
jgi:hypothetical protein